MMDMECSLPQLNLRLTSRQRLTAPDNITADLDLMPQILGHDG